MKIVVSDVDDTVASLVETWIKLYNVDFKDNIKKSDIVAWDIGSFIKNPNNRQYLYEYIEDPTIYDKIKPIKDSLWGINKLKNMGYRVVFATASTIGASGRKYRWLKDYGFIDSKSDYIECYDKNLVRGDYIIDDRFDNVINFQGKGILYSQPWNLKDNWNMRCNNWKEVINLISSEQ